MDAGVAAGSGSAPAALGEAQDRPSSLPTPSPRGPEGQLSAGASPQERSISQPALLAQAGSPKKVPMSLDQDSRPRARFENRFDTGNSSSPMTSFLSDAAQTGADRSNTSWNRIDLVESAGPSTNSASSYRRPFPRVFEVWDQVGGKSRILCRGRCVTGPDIDFGYNTCAWTFIVLPVGAYFAFVAPYLWDHVTIWLPILTSGIFVSTVVFMCLTQCTDPGIIPRQKLQGMVRGLEREVEEVTGAAPIMLLDAAVGVLDAPVQLTSQQQAAGYKWCISCKVVRPPRASHCPDCDNCVLMYDHHCPFVGNCVGQRNYVFFVGFLSSTICLGFAVAVGFLLYSANSTLDLRSPAVLALLLLIGLPTALLLSGVLVLAIFHTWLACTGRTTKEVCRGLPGPNRRPEARTLATTVSNDSGPTIFSMRGPSLLHTRERVCYPMLVA